MKTKLVLRGQKGGEENAEKVLIAIELIADENKTECWIFEDALATEELADQLMTAWRKDEAVAFPEGALNLKNELSASGNIVPEGYTVTEKDDLIKRTQTEWLFIVLSTKLFKSYEAELNELQEKVEKMPKYGKEMWEELKAFQNKIQAQVQEQNLFRDHTNILRERLNELFGVLKNLRQKDDNAFENAAKDSFDKVTSVLNQIDEALEKNSGEWAKWFDKLKNLQQELKTMKLTRENRVELWARIDKAFKDVKERRFGNKSIETNSGVSAESRLQKRIEGLKLAIQKMQNSVERDENELDFQNKKLNSVNASQLETQLREVRSKMILDRLSSKKEKLADMNKTLADLESRLSRILSKTASEEDLKIAEMQEENQNTEEIGQSEESVENDNTGE
jgi:chromosome segregation ATPase